MTVAADKARLEHLLAQSLLDEARRIERQAWSTQGATDFEKPVAATERRMRAETTEALARRRLRAQPRKDGSHARQR